jgi:hypothetical protein
VPLPIGHAQPSRRSPVTRRERWLIAAVVSVTVVLAAVVAISFTSHQRTSRGGCIDVSAATVIGGSELYRCGAAARGLCTAARGARRRTVGGQNISFRRALADACRRAGLPVPPVVASS